MPTLNGRKIAWLRGQRGWSKLQAAGAAGISREEWIRRVERYLNVSWDTAMAVAGAFGVGVGEILAEWEVKEYRVFAKVEPRERETFKRRVGYQPRREMSVVTDNWARVTKIVEFSANAGRSDPFLLQYRTRSGGLVFVPNDHDLCNPERNAFLHGPPHRWAPFFDNGIDVAFECTPRYPSIQNTAYLGLCSLGWIQTPPRIGFPSNTPPRKRQLSPIWKAARTGPG
jgi:transcriptional regulator with XRE-family HTH domain